MILKTALMGAVACIAVAPMAYADAHEGERGRDGDVNIIYWQAVSIMNPFLSGASRTSRLQVSFWNHWPAMTEPA